MVHRLGVEGFMCWCACLPFLLKFYNGRLGHVHMQRKNVPPKILLSVGPKDSWVRSVDAGLNQITAVADIVPRDSRITRLQRTCSTACGMLWCWPSLPWRAGGSLWLRPRNESGSFS